MHIVSVKTGARFLYSHINRLNDLPVFCMYYIFFFNTKEVIYKEFVIFPPESTVRTVERP